MLALSTMRILAAKMLSPFCGPDVKACFQIDTSIASLDPLTPPISEPFKTGNASLTLNPKPGGVLTVRCSGTVEFLWLRCRRGQAFIQRTAKLVDKAHQFVWVGLGADLLCDGIPLLISGVRGHKGGPPFLIPQSTVNPLDQSEQY